MLQQSLHCVLGKSLVSLLSRSRQHTTFSVLCLKQTYMLHFFFIIMLNLKETWHIATENMLSIFLTIMLNMKYKLLFSIHLLKI